MLETIKESPELILEKPDPRTIRKPLSHYHRSKTGRRRSDFEKIEEAERGAWEEEE